MTEKAENRLDELRSKKEDLKERLDGTISRHREKQIRGRLRRVESRIEATEEELGEADRLQSLWDRAAARLEVLRELSDECEAELSAFQEEMETLESVLREGLERAYEALCRWQAHQAEMRNVLEECLPMLVEEKPDTADVRSAMKVLRDVGVETEVAFSNAPYRWTRSTGQPYGTEVRLEAGDVARPAPTDIGDLLFELLEELDEEAESPTGQITTKDDPLVDPDPEVSSDPI
jgi:hypothetical protein